MAARYHGRGYVDGMRDPSGHPIVAATLDWVMRPLDPLREHVVPRARGKVLEVGVGTGLNLDRYDPSRVSEVDAIDPDPYMLARAEPRAARSPVPVRLHRTGAEALPFPDEHFDTVLCTFVLCTIPDVDAALAELHRVLRPDGQLLYVEHTVADGAIRHLQHAVQPVWGRVSGGCHLDRDPQELLRRAGFQVAAPHGHGRNALNLTPVWRGQATKAQAPTGSGAASPPKRSARTGAPG